MQLKLTRSQRQTALARTAVFCVDARIEFTHEEQASVTKYKLGSQVIYNSEAAKRHLAKAEVKNDGSALGGFKSLASVAMAALQLNITVNSLQRGQHIECKDLDEVLGAEDALMTACKNLRAYLDTAVTFDGREVVVDFSGEEPAVALPKTPAVLIPPSAPAIGSAAAQPVIDAVAQPASTAATAAPAMSGSATYAPAASIFDDVMFALKRFWDNATPAMRAVVCIGGAIVLILLYRAL